MPSALSLSDFEQQARRILPRGVFGYVSGGVETDLSLRLNAESFDCFAFRPQVLTDIAQRDMSVEVFGQRYDAPFGVCPMGGIALGYPRGDLALAQAAAAENLPFLLSGASSEPLEVIREAAPTAWFQAYLPPKESAALALVERVARAGYGVLVVTVDVPVVGNRENLKRLGFSLPMRLSMKVVADVLTRPRWLLSVAARTVLTSGVPHFENQGIKRGPPIFSGLPSGERNGARTPPPVLIWSTVEAVRRLWKGRLVIKGILTAEDARRAAECGADGVIVSNHGGRQLDGVVAPLSVLAEVAKAVPELTVMMDGGVRRGTHVLKALALGARFVFVGRPMYYAVTAGGVKNARHAMRLLKFEIDNDMALLGISRMDQLGPNMIAAV